MSFISNTVKRIQFYLNMVTQSNKDETIRLLSEFDKEIVVRGVIRQILADSDSRYSNMYLDIITHFIRTTNDYRMLINKIHEITNADSNAENQYFNSVSYWQMTIAIMLFYHNNAINEAYFDLLDNLSVQHKIAFIRGCCNIQVSFPNEFQSIKHAVIQAINNILNNVNLSEFDKFTLRDLASSI